MYTRKLLVTDRSVFRVDDLAKLWQVERKEYLRVVVARMVKGGVLKRLAEGIYSQKEDYDVFELANKLRRPSYVSLERILFEEGVIFQGYAGTVTSVGRNSEELEVGGVTYSYVKFKDSILANPLGITRKGEAVIAGRERAVADMIYAVKDFYFDNPDGIDKNKLMMVAGIYNNKRVEEEVKRLCGM